ncbi:hypothetical protein DVH24_006714 [Malus domestica]|uniref:Uncharacterized protein n=1 Tax=Malus domestica TaxID=3750 RepID=A0A498KDN6_MALDO|nr:hypothetical protein DVH24_006714 [Malus domestica]
MAGSSVLDGSDGVMVVATAWCCRRGEKNQAVVVLGPGFSGISSRRMAGWVVPLWVATAVRLDG